MRRDGDADDDDDLRGKLTIDILNVWLDVVVVNKNPDNVVASLFAGVNQR